MTTKKLGRMLGWVVAAGLALAMAACSGPTTPPGDSGTPTSTPSGTQAATGLPSAPEPSIVPSDNMDGIDATGGFGEAPELTIPSPWAIKTTQTKILVQGDGPTVPEGAFIQVRYYGKNARSGEVFDENYSSDEKFFTMSLSGLIPGWQKGVAGQKVGTRLIIAVPGADGYDGSGGRPDNGIEIGDTLVFVIDIIRTSFSEPTGETVAVTDSSLPTVTGEIAAPVVTIPSTTTPPSTLVTQPLIIGTGPAVEAADTIMINYSEYIWSSGTLVRTTYGFGTLQGLLSQTIPAWKQALPGQPTGSRLLLVVPPDLAYSQGSKQNNIPEGSTMVYLVDILYAASA